MKAGSRRIHWCWLNRNNKNQYLAFGIWYLVFGIEHKHKASLRGGRNTLASLLEFPIGISPGCNHNVTTLS
jgi:hypothetical protein